MYNYANIIEHEVSDLEWSIFGDDVKLSQKYANEGDTKMAIIKMREALSKSKINGYDLLPRLCKENAYFLVDKSDECDN